MSSPRHARRPAKCRAVARTAGSRSGFLPGHYRTTGADLRNLLRAFFGRSFCGPHLNGRVWRAARHVLGLPDAPGPVSPKERVFLPLDGLRPAIQAALPRF